MNHATPPVQIEALFTLERTLVPEPDEVRHRVCRRARASVPRRLHQDRAVASSNGPRRPAIGRMAAAAIVLSALCSAAFYAGYSIKVQGAVVPDPPAVTDGVGDVKPGLPGAAPMTVPSAAPVPSCTPVSSATAPAPATRGSLPAKTEPRGGARSEVQAYAMELRLLQPAQQAVARQDYGSALAAIAEHRRRFPSGKLAEEREALRVKALLGLGRDGEAKSAGGAFRERFPQSALRGRLDEMLERQD
jgi:hypothetical protein